jgi:hypothetical protein
MPLSGRLKDQITPPALAAMAAITMKKLILSIELQKLPSHRDEIADEAGAEPQAHHRRDHARQRDFRNKR